MLFFHMYSCLDYYDWEIWYRKLSRKGLFFFKRNMWADFYKRGKPSDFQYKIIPKQKIEVETMDLNIWKLIWEDRESCIFLPKEQASLLDIQQSQQVDENCKPTGFGFLISFPLCIYVLFDKLVRMLEVMDNQCLLFLIIGSSGFIYISYVWAFLNRLYMKKKKQKKERTQKFKITHSWFSFILSSVVNLIQVGFIGLLFYILF